MQTTTWKFFREETQQWEDVPTVEWQWVAQYLDDGTILKQYDDDGIFHQFREINQNRPMAFKMVSQNKPFTHTLLFNPRYHHKLIHKYINTVFDANTPDEVKVRSFVFGYEQKILGKTYKHFIVITNNDEIIVTDDYNQIQFEKGNANE